MISSFILEDHFQKDGRIWVYETHVDINGIRYDSMWLADNAKLDFQAIADTRGVAFENALLDIQNQKIIRETTLLKYNAVIDSAISKGQLTIEDLGILGVSKANG